MRPFGCPVTILNTLDPLGKLDGKADKGFLVGYFINSMAFRVFNTRTRKVEENLHITFLENKPNVAGSGPDWLFDIDLLTNYMNHEPVPAGNQTNRNAGIKDNVDVVPTQKYILLPLLSDSLQSLEDTVADDAGKKTTEEPANEGERNGQEKEGGSSNKEVSTVSPSISAAGKSFVNDLPTDPLIPDFEDTTDLLNIGIFSGAYDDKDVGAEADLNNLETTMNLPHTSVPIPNVADEVIFKEWDDRVVRATTTAASLDAAHASGNITKTQSTTMSNDHLSQEIGLGDRPSDEERIKHQELTDNIPPTPYDSPLSRGYTLGSDEGRPEFHELMAICTTLSDKVLDLEKEKDAQAVEILKLKNIIKKLERKAKSSIPPPKRRLYKHVNSFDDSLGEENASKQGRNDSNKTEEFNLSDKVSGGTKAFDDTNAAEKDVNAAEPVSTAGDVDTAASVILDIDTAGPSNVSAVSPSISTAGDIFEDEMMTDSFLFRGNYNLYIVYVFQKI
ncbi:hypothetical protein Tco_1169043 [Tanacetum coccineum]